MAASTIDPNILLPSGEIGRASSEGEFSSTVIAAINDHAALIDSGGGGGGTIDGSGTAGKLAKWSDANTLTDSAISESGGRILPGAPVNHTMMANSDAYQHQVIMQDTDHVGEAVAVVGYVDPMTVDCTATGASIIGGQFKANGTRSAGANTIVNTAVQAEAYMGTGVSAAYSFLSLNGALRNDGSAQLGNTAGTGITIGAGTTAPADTVQINKALTVAAAYAVTLGSTVQPFTIPGTTTSNPYVNSGWTAAPLAQLATKNTMTAGSFGGLEVHLDTTVSATARGGLQIYRSAGGGAEIGGYNCAGGANHFASGTAAGDICAHVYGAANKWHVATGTTPTVRMTVDAAGKVTCAAPAQGIEMGVSGPRIMSGSGSPESAVTAPIGSLWMRTDGGASTTLYAKESGTGNTGWVAK